MDLRAMAVVTAAIAAGTALAGWSQARAPYGRRRAAAAGLWLIVLAATVGTHRPISDSVL